MLYQTPGMLSHPPIPVTGLNTHIEELKEDGEDQRLEWKHMGPCIAGYTVTFTSQDGTELTDEVET